MSNVPYVYNALMQRGMQPHIAAALTGNMMQESGPTINPVAVGDNGNAFGMAQWNGPRRRALMEFGRGKGMDPREIDTQIEFLMHELQGPESKAWGAIQQAPDAQTAALIASQQFWRPGIPHNENRQRYAGEVLAQFGERANDASPQFSREEIAAELKRRGVSLPGGDQPPPPGGEQAQPGFSRDEIAAELKRRGVALPDSPGEAQQAPVPAEGMTALEEGEMRAQPGSYWGGMLDSVMNGITFGYGDEVRALDAAILGETPEGEYLDYSRPFWERYDVALGAEQKQRERFKRDMPIASTVGEVGGAVATGGGLAKQGVTLTGKAATRGGKVAAGATEGALYGGVYGSGEAERGKRLEGGAYGAAGGAAAGGLLTLGGIKFMDALAKRGVIKSAPTNNQLRVTAGKAADTARSQGVVYNGHSYQDFFNGMERQLMDQGLDKGLTPSTWRVMKRLNEIKGAQPSFDEIEKLRRIAASAAGSKEPADRRLAMMVVDGLDDFMATPRNVAFATGDAALANASMVEMRRDWSRMRRAEMLDEALAKAERRADSTGSGGNIENAIRQNVRTILDNPKSRRGFSPQEIEALENVVRGGKVRDTLRLLGKISPQGNGLSMFLNLGAVYMEPSFLAATLAGTGAKFLSDRATRQSARLASALIRSGGGMPGVPNVPAGLPQGAGGYAGQLLGDLAGGTKAPLPVPVP